MRITKRQLRRIIKEEKASLIKEQTARPRSKTSNEWYDALMNFIDQDMTARDVDMRDEESYELIKALEDLRREFTDEKRGPTR